LIDVDFGSSKAETLALRGDLEALAIPLDDVVVADQRADGQSSKCGPGFPMLDAMQTKTAH